LNYLEKVSSQTALALTKSEIKRRITEGWKPKYDKLLIVNDGQIISGELPDKKGPQFTCQVSAQEIVCNVSVKDGTEIVAGSEHISANTYRITVCLHDEPDIPLTGHYWQITEFAKVGEMRQLV
jgi:hypothetical protein